jgi:hypothetical protein
MEAIRFLQWQWRQWSISDKFYMLAVGLISGGFAGDYPALYKTGGGILLIMFFKWAVIDQTVKSYNEYKRQRDSLFDEIKGN